MASLAETPEVAKLLDDPAFQPPEEMPEDEILAALETELTPDEFATLEEAAPDALEEESGDVVGESKAALGSGARLPHEAQLQAAFGHHSVADVKVSVGGRAGGHAERMGADAFAVGERIGSREPMDLRTVAHEAAHVIQQRGGSVPGGEGRAGDRHEAQADEVANAVVAGRSAEALLDRTGAQPGDHAPGVTVQRQGELPKPPFGDGDLQTLTKDQLDALYKEYRKSHPKEAEKVKRMQKSKGFRGSSQKRKKKHLSKKAGKKSSKKAGKSLAKKGLGAVTRKVPLVGAMFFLYDWNEGGFGHAVNELVWPLSELWTD